MEVFIHIKTGNPYIISKRTIVKINGKWLPCIIYQNAKDEQFVRLEEDFKESFKPTTKKEFLDVFKDKSYR